MATDGRNPENYPMYGPGDMTITELKGMGYTELLTWILPDGLVGIAPYNSKLFGLSRENYKHEIEKTMFGNDAIKVFTFKASSEYDTDRGTSVVKAEAALVSLEKKGAVGRVKVAGELKHGSVTGKAGVEHGRITSALMVVPGVEVKGSAKTEIANESFTAALSGCVFCFGWDFQLGLTGVKVGGAIVVGGSIQFTWD